MDKKFEPIINTKKKKTSLVEKNVEIKGNNDFSRSSAPLFQKEQEQIISDKVIEDSVASKKIVSKVDSRYKATMTQKISPSVNLKINTLKPFLGDLEDMPKATVNDILNLLLDSYVNTKFSTRQQEAFNSMYNTQIDLLKK